MLESIEELRVFAQVVDSGSQTAAARVLNMRTNTVSRRLASLEERMGTRLLFRTTRSSSLTDAGEILLHRCRRILAEVDEVADELLPAGPMGGTVRICVPTLFLRLNFIGRLAELMDQHPALRFQIRVTDQPVNPIADGIELALHAGELRDSALIARRMVDVSPVLAASPAYAARHGLPKVPAELSAHEALTFIGDTPQDHWTIVAPDGEPHVVPVQGRISIDASRPLFDALIAGLGIGLVAEQERTRGVANGTMVAVLPGYSTPPIPLYAVYPPSLRRNARLKIIVALFDQVLAGE